MRVLVVGYGSIGRRHAANAKDLGHEVMVHDARWAAPLYDGPADRYWVAANAGGAHAWDPHAVVIATPASTHAALLREWFPLPTLCEKPLALSAADLLPHDGVSRIQVGCNWRRHELVEALMARILTQVGTRPARAAILWCVTDMQTWPGTGYADALLECGSHEIDLALWMFGPARLESVRRFGAERWILRLTHETDCRTSVILDGMQAGAPLRGMRVSWGDYQDGYDVPPGDPMTAQALDRSYRIEMAAFLDCAELGLPMSPSFQDGLAVLRICDQARAMADEAAHA